MAVIYFSCERKIKKIYYYIFTLTLLFILSFIIPLLMQSNAINDNIIFAMSRILFIIPYILYNKYKKYSLKVNFNFTKNDWIIFSLFIPIRFFLMAFQLFINNKVIYIVVNYFIIRYFQYLFIIFFLSLLMKFVSKFKFYIHHIISLIISSLILAALSVAAILKINFRRFETPHLIILIIITLLNFIFISISITYYKFLIDEKNISFYIICFFYGLIDFLFIIVSIIIYNATSIISDLFISINYKVILSSLLVLIYYIAYNLFFYRTISEHPVIYGEIVDVYTTFLSSLISISINKLPFRAGFLIAFEGILILISSFIFTEIIELKIYGLNRNTRRCILKREIEEKRELDEVFDDLIDEKVEISRGYFIEIGFNPKIQSEY